MTRGTGGKWKDNLREAERSVPRDVNALALLRVELLVGQDRLEDALAFV